MSNSYSQISLVFLSYASIQGIVLVVILSSFRKGNRKANLTLAILTSCIVLLTSQFVAILLKWHEAYSLFALPLSTLRYAIGPLMLLYVKQLLNQKIKHTEAFHYLIFVIISIWVVYVLAQNGLQHASLRITKVLASTSVDLSINTYSLMLFNKLHPMAYGIASLVLLNKYKKINQEQASNVPDQIHWLIKLCLLFIACQLLSISAVILFYFNNYYTIYLDIFVVFCYSIIIYFIGVSAIIWSESIFPVYKEPIVTRLKQYDDHKIADLKKRISIYVETHKSFLNPNLKLNDLAQSLQLSPHELSYIINNAFGMNFYDFINRYRVSELKSRISKSQNQQFTLLGNALEVGFNSKASFNRNFKKHTGLTPSAYLKSIRK